MLTGRQQRRESRSSLGQPVAERTEITRERMERGPGFIGVSPKSERFLPRHAHNAATRLRTIVLPNMIFEPFVSAIHRESNRNFGAASRHNENEEGREGVVLRKAADSRSIPVSGRNPAIILSPVWECKQAGFWPELTCCFSRFSRRSCKRNNRPTIFKFPGKGLYFRPIAETTGRSF